MAPRRTYSDEDRASAYVTLVSNDMNIKRSARDTGFDPATLRRWVKGWETEGAPDTGFTQLVQAEVGSFLADAKRVRGKALATLEGKISLAKPGELITVIGVLDDKITRASGLATSRTETISALPAPEVLREIMAGFIEGAISASRTRQGEVIEVELVEQPRRGLPA